MHDPSSTQTGKLLALAASGDTSAAQSLLEQHRMRLRRLIACRMDQVLAARVDPSDIVQDALLVAHRRLPEYLLARPIAFYPWLRQIACDRLADVYRRHLGAQRRSVQREVSLHLPDESASRLGRHLIASGASPFQHLADAELRERVRSALCSLSVNDQEVIALRFVELLAVQDAAQVLNISTGAFKVRQVRALQRLRALLAVEDSSK